MKSTGYNSKTSWIAIAALVVIEFLMPLLMRLSGLFYVIILDTYNVDREQAVIPIATYGITRTISGPLVGFLGEIFGLQLIIVIGCILEVLGIGLSCIAKDINMLIISLGIIYGTGYSLTKNLIPSVIRQHFTESINLTNGIVLTGGLVGAIVMTPVIHHLKNSYGTSGMFLILSGFFLHSLPASILIGNPRNEELKSRKRDFKKNNSNQSIKLIQNGKFHSNCVNENITELINLKQIISEKNYQSLNFKDTNHHAKNENGHVNEFSVKRNDILSLSQPFFKKNRNISPINSFEACDTQKCNIINRNICSEKNSEINRKVFKDGICGIKTYYPETLKREDHSKNFKSEEKKNTYYERFLVFCDPVFILQMIIQSTHLFCATLIQTVMVDYARDKEISTENALYFVMFTNISQIIGSLTLNWITDNELMTRVNFCTIFFLINSLNIGFLIWSDSFPLIITGYIVLGFVNGALTSSFPGMLLDSIEKEQQNMALASRFTLYGVLCPLKSPTIGFFRSQLGSYDLVYYMIMGLLFFCGVLVKLTPIASRYQERR